MSGKTEICVTVGTGRAVRSNTDPDDGYLAYLIVPSKEKRSVRFMHVFVPRILDLVL